MQCAHIEVEPEVCSDFNPLANFGACMHNNELTVTMPTQPAISEDAGEVFSVAMQNLIAKYKEVFSKPGKPMARDIKHRIELLDPAQKIPYHRQQRMSQLELQEVKKHLEEYLSKGWIQPSTSQYNHPLLFIRKKTGELRVCIDYRDLNNNTIIDRYPLPRIDDTLDRLGKAKIFSKIDLASG